MVKVNLWTGLRHYTGGALSVEVEAETIGTMLDALVAAHPALSPVIRAGVSVAVNGIMAASKFDTLTADSEVYLIQQLKGG